MFVLGISYGHDAGAALIEDGKIKFAANEERFTKRKLEPSFPANAIRACLAFGNLKPTDVTDVAVCNCDLGNVIIRSFPSIIEKNYHFRRKKTQKPPFIGLRQAAKYKLLQYGSNAMLKKLTESQFRKHLDKLGFSNYKIHIVDHHMAHAAGAIFASGFNKSLCITLDGIGDGLSGTVNIYEDGEIKRIVAMPANDSIGIMYQHVTSLLGMRELEDEGKVMSLADYSYDIPDSENRILDLYGVEGMRIKSKYSNARKVFELEKILWNTQREKFAYMAQKTLEKVMLQLFRNCIDGTGIGKVCWSGGLASNIKANMHIRYLPTLKDWFVFPHMGDGGLSVGAALYACNKIAGSREYRMEDAYFGSEYMENEMEEQLKTHRKELEFEERKDVAKIIGEMISKENYAFWYQGRMEFGPRALGNRSIVASAFSEKIKDKLNMQVKKREWFQPFCPSMIVEDSKRIFSDYDGRPDKFMTMGYMTNERLRNNVKSVINVDGSARPQMVCEENEKYRKLIENVKKNTGYGIILNTSFNVHGSPIVNSPADAIDTMLKTKTKTMAMGNFLVTLK